MKEYRRLKSRKKISSLDWYELWERSKNSFRLQNHYKKEAEKLEIYSEVLKQEIHRRIRLEEIETKAQLKREKVRTKKKVKPFKTPAYEFVDEAHEQRFFKVLKACCNTPKK